MSKYDKDRQSLGLPISNTSSVTSNKTSKYASERQSILNGSSLPDMSDNKKQSPAPVALTPPTPAQTSINQDNPKYWEKHPVMKFLANNPVAEAWDKNVAPWLDVMGKEYRKTLFGETQQMPNRAETTGSSVGDVTAKIFGTIGAFSNGGTGGTGLTGAANTMSKSVVNKMAPVVDTAVQKIGKRVIQGAVESVPYSAQQIATQKDINTPQKAVRTAGANVLFGAGAELGLMGAGKLIKAPAKQMAENVTKSTDNNAGSLSDITKQTLQKNLSKNAMENDEVYQEIVKELEGVKSNSDSYIKDIASTIKDKSGLSYDLKDPYRNFKDAFGKNFEAVKSSYLDPFDNAKKRYVETIQQHTDDIYNKVVKGFGIQKHSKESAAVQWLGEGKKPAKVTDPQTGKNVWGQVDYTLDDLKREFPDKWQNIVEADKLFRSNYDELIDKINASREAVYPNVEKEVAKVNDDIASLKQAIQEKKISRQSMEQGRFWDTNREIILKSQLDILQKRKSDYQAKLSTAKQDTTKKKYTDMINSIEKQLDIKAADLKKAKLYRQPTAKQFDQADGQLTRLTELLKKKEELIKSDELWKNKRLQKRKDYYRHFNELSGFSELKNIFETPAQISSKLAGISEFTKPKTKFASLFQRRDMGKYKADAVGGFLNYIPSASYAINIDPQIAKFRGLAKDIAEGTADTKNANNFIKYLDNFSNSLAGKTNQYDRLWQEKVPGERKAFAVLNWVNSHVKSNQVLMNARSALSQLANIPVGIAKIKNPVDIYKGMTNTFAGMVGKGRAPELYKQSQFITERYSNNLISRFNTRLADQPEKLAAWLMETADEIGTKFIWNSTYEQAVKNGANDAIKQADDITRSLVAGRGIGEVPLLQQSKTFKLVAPFQLEVANLWHVMKDMVSEKDFAGIATLMVGNYLFNEAAENLTGNRVVFDPINAMMDALSEEDANAGTVVGRMAGEIGSNIPIGNVIASTLFDDSTRKKYFGNSDPARYGTGVVTPVLTKAGSSLLKFAGGEKIDNLAPDLLDIGSKLILPFGGAQLKKTVEGVKAVNAGGDYSINTAGEKSLKYPILKTPGNYIKAGVFGKYALPEAKEYYDNARRPLSPKQTQIYESMADNGKEMYNAMMKKREIDSLKDQITKVLKDGGMDPDKKQKKVSELYGRLITLSK